MKSVISTTYDNNYLFFLPIVIWCWNKLGVDVICFMPEPNDDKKVEKVSFVKDRMRNKSGSYDFKSWQINTFCCPEHKEATYAQCSRLYAACLDLPEDEILMTSDCDMALFKIPQNAGSHISVFGNDLVPHNQVPICYISADVKEWRRVFKINGRTYQECLDDLLGNIEAEHFRGNYWGKDQEESYNNIFGNHGHAVLLPRARPGTQFASNRIDRDDSFWEDRLTPEIIDAHLWRPGYTDENFPKILKLLRYFYPDENFGWLINYRNEYIKIL